MPVEIKWHHYLRTGSVVDGRDSRPLYQLPRRYRLPGTNPEPLKSRMRKRACTVEVCCA